MSRFKRFIKNIFPLGGLRIFKRASGDAIQSDEFILLNRFGNSSAAQRQIINDEQFLISFSDFLQEVTNNLSDDGVVTGISFSSPNLTLTRSEGLPDLIVDLSALETLDGVVTGATLEAGNILTLTRSESLPNITVDLSALLGTDDQTASEVNTSAIPGVAGTQVQAMLASLKGLIDNVLFTSLNTDGGAVNIVTVNTTPLDSLFLRLTVNNDITSISFSDTSRMRLFIMKFVSTGISRSIEFGPGFIFDESNNNLTNFTLGASPERITVMGWFDGVNWHCTIVSRTGGETNTASNLGAGAGVFESKSGVDLRLRSIIGGSNLTATQNTNDITLDVDAAFWPLSGTGSITGAGNIIQSSIEGTTGLSFDNLRNFFVVTNDNATSQTRNTFRMQQPGGSGIELIRLAPDNINNYSFSLNDNGINMIVGAASLNGGYSINIPDAPASAMQVRDFNVSPTGIEYFGDYSSTFVNRSLVDKEYVDTELNNRIRIGSITITSVELLSLNTTPIQILAAPGASLAYIFYSGTAIYNFGTTEYLTNFSLTPRYIGGTPTTALTVDFVNLISGTESKIGVVNARFNPVVLTDIENRGVEMFCLAGNPTAGDGTVTFQYEYRIISV